MKISISLFIKMRLIHVLNIVFSGVTGKGGGGGLTYQEKRGKEKREKG